MNKIGKVLGCVYLRWSTLDEVDYFRMEEEEDEVPKVFERFGIEPFSSIAGLVSVERVNCPIKLFMYPKHFAHKDFTLIHLLRILKKPFKALNISYYSFQVFSLYL